MTRIILLVAIFFYVRAGAQVAPATSKGQPIDFKSDVATFIKQGGKTIGHLKGHCQFVQGSSNMTSDSALMYQDDNRLDAFGHVVIHQADTVTILGDKLNYDGSTRLAKLFDNITMTDRQGVLTTNHLDYDMNTKIGTYYDGGKITNVGNILISKTGYYYETTKVAYFKNEVTILTPQTTINSDTLQYNTLSHIAYFFGPTRIHGKDDFIYCENGMYNTTTDQANFSKRAYYLNGSKKLYGDSLYYDKKTGFGKAVKNMVFRDSVQNVILTGDYGEYDKYTETTIATKKPLLMVITVENVATDSTKRDASGGASNKKKRKSKINQEAPPPREPIHMGSGGGPNGLSLALGIRDSLPAKKRVKIEKVRIDTIFLTADTLKTVLASGERSRPHLAPRPLVKSRKAIKRDSIALNNKADQLLNKIRQKAADSLAGRNKKNPLSRNSVTVHETAKTETVKTPVKQAVVRKKEKIGFFRRLFGRRKTKDTVAKKKPEDEVNLLSDTAKAISKLPALSPGAADSLNRGLVDKKIKIPYLLDNVARPLRAGFDLRKAYFDYDTTHYRVVYAFHKARLFKSDFQAAGDSMIYTYIDSTIRCFKKPILWTQGTQMTSDTITIRLKNQKIDSLIMIRMAFIISRLDSIHTDKFNQISGRDMFGKFSNNKLVRMRVEGNGKSLYYATEDKVDSSGKGKVKLKVRKTKTTGINSTIASYFLMQFKDNKPDRINAVDQPESVFFPPQKITPGKERLEGFLWRDSERPKSRKDIFHVPTRAEKELDSAVNRKVNQRDSTSTDFNQNILDIKIPKKKKGPAKKKSPVDSIQHEQKAPEKPDRERSPKQPRTDSTNGIQRGLQTYIKRRNSSIAWRALAR